MGYLSLHTTFPPSPPPLRPTTLSYARSDTATTATTPTTAAASPLSSTPTSPTTSSPTSSPRRFCRAGIPWPSLHTLNSAKVNANNIHHNSHATDTYSTHDYYHDGCSGRSRSQSPLRLPASAFPIPFPSLRRRCSSIFQRHFRRRPSKVDIALSEERSRCDEDVIERLGLELLEPRPVDVVSYTGMVGGSGGLNGLGGWSGVGEGRGTGRGRRESVGSLGLVSASSSSPSLPRFVMGGIEEVLKGEA